MNFDFSKTVSHGLAASVLSNNLSGVCGAFAGAAEAHLTSGGPTDHVSDAICDGHHGVIECRTNMNHASANIFRTLGLDDLGCFSAVTTTDLEPNALRDGTVA